MGLENMEKEELILRETVQMIQQEIKQNHATLYLEGFASKISREALKKVIADDFSDVLDTEEKLEYVVREIVGLSFIEYLVEDERITDIGFDGDKLIVQGNNFEKTVLDGVTEDDVIKIIAKFQNSTAKELTIKDPILNTSRDHLRLNAVDKSIAINGTTMAIRVSRPGLRITEENFSMIAPLYVLDFIKAAVKTKSNIMICGETGTGKTELQKLMMSFIPFEERIALIESNKDLYAKENFPNKDIFYWVSNGNTTIEDLIAYAALRSYPKWIMVAEVLGREVYQVLQGILTGHKFTCTLHAVDCRAIPRRLLGMAKMGYTVDENMFLDDIYNYVDFGIHLKANGGVRYLSEIVEYHSDRTATTIFKQILTKDGFKITTDNGELSPKFFERVMEEGMDYKGLVV